MSSESSESHLIQCGTHGPMGIAVVCCHLLEPTDRILGFVENEPDPEDPDPQAWCDECETRFLAEGGLTDAFRAFNGMRVICEACFIGIRARHEGSNLL